MWKIIRRCVKLPLRCNPFYRSGARIALSPKLGSLNRDCELVLTRLRRGLSLLVYINDYCGRVIYYTGDYDRRITWICRRLLRPGDCFLDIGANFGEVGLYAAKFVGPSGQVHVFEPQAKLANLIRVSAELNGFKHVHTHEVALSGKDGQFNFFVPRGYTCVGSLAADTSSSSEIDVMKVQARKAGTYLEQLKLPRIRVIKVDVEGHEEQILSGALDFLRSNKPAAIIFESHDSGQAFFDRNVVKQIASLGYNFYQIKQKVLLRVRLKKLQYNESIENGYDFVALSSEPEDKNVYRLLGVS